MEGRKEGRKETRILLNFNFILGSNNHSVGVETFLEPIEIDMSPRQGVEIY